jgi:hypothetical protein
LGPVAANQELTAESWQLTASLSLPLLVFLVRANHAHDAAAPHDLALVANPFD